MTPMADDRDSLSALFDGELRDDAARFAARRLGHDIEWRRSIERWQVIGDVLRGEASMLAPSGFSERVAAALSAPADADGDLAPSVPTMAAARAIPRRARLWTGMAVAASVAAVAAFVVPLMRSEFEPAPTTVSAPGIAPVSPPLIAPVNDASRVASAAARPPARRTRAGTRMARADRTRAGITAPIVEAPRIAARPFQPPVDDTITTRPWPRATLPGLQTGGAFTAGYSVSDEGPSFYPFEPDAGSSPSAPAPSP